MDRAHRMPRFVAGIGVRQARIACGLVLFSYGCGLLSTPGSFTPLCAEAA